jgi:hypothetical protein
MKLVNHAWPEEFAWVAGLPTRTDELPVKEGQSEIAIASEMFDCEELSGSLNPRTVVYPALTRLAISLVIPAAVCSLPVWPQIIGTNGDVVHPLALTVQL